MSFEGIIENFREMYEACIAIIAEISLVLQMIFLLRRESCSDLHLILRVRGKRGVVKQRCFNSRL